MADRNGYIGRAPGDSSVVVARQVFSPTGVQTDFTFASGYTVGYLDAYLNGVRLIEGQDYNATDTSTVGLTSFAQSGDILELVAYKAFNVATIDNAPGNLTVGTNLTVGGYISAGGSITGSVFYGDGSNLTGIAATDNVRTNTLVVSGVSTLGSSTGIGTVYVGLGSTALYVEGDARITGILTVGTSSITLDGNTNIANVGTGVTIYGNTGIVSATTFYGDGSNLSGISVNRFLSVDTRVGVVTVTAFAGILTVFGRTSDTNILV